LNIPLKLVTSLVTATISNRPLPKLINFNVSPDDKFSSFLTDAGIVIRPLTLGDEILKLAELESYIEYQRLRDSSQNIEN
jgi:hypothetical protein